MAHRLSPGKPLCLGPPYSVSTQAEVRKAAPGHVQHLLPAWDLWEWEMWWDERWSQKDLGVKEPRVSRGDGMGYNNPGENPKASGHSQ